MIARDDCRFRYVVAREALEKSSRNLQQLWGDFACARGAFARTKRSLIMLRPSLGPVADLLAKLVTSAASKGVKPDVDHHMVVASTRPYCCYDFGRGRHGHQQWA